MALFIERRSVERRLRHRGVTRETTAAVMQLLADLDEAAWSPTTAVDRTAARQRAALEISWSDRIKAVTQAVEAEAMPPSQHGRTERGVAPRSGPRGGSVGRPGSATLWMAVAGAMAFALGGAAALPARGAAFQNALAQYDAHEYAAAADGFFAIARAEPRDADAWANAGTASWAAGDTVRTVVGWQRALRLEPRASDVRERLALVGRSSQTGVARVANRPRDLAAAVTLLLWCLAWGLLAVAQRPVSNRPDPHLVSNDVHAWPLIAQRWAVALLVACVVTAFWHWQSSRSLEGTRLAVVSHLEPLRVSPGDAEGALGGTMRGDIVETGGERIGAAGARWVAVEHADGRTGWLPARALLALSAP